MNSHKQNELIKFFVKNVLNYSLNGDLQNPMENSKNMKNKEILNRIVKHSKFKPLLNELINDYFSNIDKHNSNIDIELPYIVQILAIINNSIEYIPESK